MLMIMDASECPICQKHRGVGELVGPVIYSDELVQVSHRSTGPGGYAFIETRRHVAYVDELTDDEAAAIGRLRTRLTRGMRAELDVEFVHALVAGTGVAHFHEHVFVRQVGTPSDYPWWRYWTDGPPGDLEDLARRLSGYLD